MSALPDEPDHFWSWLCDTHHAVFALEARDDPSCFAPRTIYGDYLADLITPFVAQGNRPGRLHIVHGECLSVDESRSGVTVTLADGSHHFGDVTILATGHDTRSKTEGCTSTPGPRHPTRAWPVTRKLIVGTGLTMVDYVLSLEAAGHTGPIVAISRRGQLPRVDRLQRPISIDAADVPFDAGIAQLSRWLRNLVRTQAARRRRLAQCCRRPSAIQPADLATASRFRAPQLFAARARLVERASTSDATRSSGAH